MAADILIMPHPFSTITSSLNLLGHCKLQIQGFQSKEQWTYGPTLCLSIDTHICSLRLHSLKPLQRMRVSIDRHNVGPQVCSVLLFDGDAVCWQSQVYHLDQGSLLHMIVLIPEPDHFQMPKVAQPYTREFKVITQGCLCAMPSSKCSGHLVHLQWGTVHALHAIYGGHRSYTVAIHSVGPLYCQTVCLQCALQRTVRPLHFELGSYV